MMTIELDTLAGALREEMQQYGEMLALLKEQQEAIMTRDAAKVAAVDEEIQQTIGAVSEARRERERILAEVVDACGAEGAESLTGLLPHFPAAMRPMFSAMIAEVNELLENTRRKARQNQSLLMTMLDTTREAIRILRPSAAVQTYDNRGRVGGRN